MEIHDGVPVSAGIAIGRVFLLETLERNVPLRPVDPDAVDGELARIERAFTDAMAGLAELREQAGVESEIAAIFSTHDMMLADVTLRASVTKVVRTKLVSAENAVVEVFDALVERFESLDEQYFAQRASDIRDIERRLLRCLLGDRQEEIRKLEGGVVIAAHDLTPSQTAQLDRDQTLGFLTDVGGPTSHTAIVARGLGMPAVVGLGDITAKLSDGQTVIVDGNKGQVIVDPDPAQLERYERMSLGHARYEAELAKGRDYPSETRDGHAIELMGNIELPDEVGKILAAGGDGVGLFRTEFLFQPGKPPPDEEAHFRAYREALRTLAGRPLTIRTLDFGADKFTPDGAAQKEPNPFLGCRSIRLCLERPSLFIPQLRAILRASAFGRVRCLFPMISSLQELRRAKDLLEKARVQLRTEGHYIAAELPVGVMVEIPAAAVVADHLVEEVDFLSIGTNDLVQYSLAVDRVNERVAYLYQPAHPALLRLIRNVVRVADDRGSPVGVCGAMAGDKLYTVLLIGMGIRELSVPPRAIPEIKRAIRSVTVEQCREAAALCAQARTTAEVLARLRDVAAERFPAIF